MRATCVIFVSAAQAVHALEACKKPWATALTCKHKLFLLRNSVESGGSIQSGDESVMGVQVFHAPHIASLGAALGSRFEPIRYRLEGDCLVSNVRFSSSLFQVQRPFPLSTKATMCGSIFLVTSFPAYNLQRCTSCYAGQTDNRKPCAGGLA